MSNLDSAAELFAAECALLEQQRISIGTPEHNRCLERVKEARRKMVEAERPTPSQERRGGKHDPA